MDQTTIDQLLQLNQKFYQTVVEPFSESRQQPWVGWQQLFSQGFFTPSTQPWRVLDLGCGNGRFLAFLTSVLGENNLEYVGVDQSLELLHLAQQIPTPPSVKTQFIETDFFSDHLSLPKIVQGLPFDLIVVFGVVHHLPSQKLRNSFFSHLHTLLKPEGKLIFTTWQFLDNQRLKEKTVDPTLLHITPNQLEENDYILDWQRGPAAYRYCHYYPETEVQELLAATNWKIHLSFLADGHDHHTNRYYVIKAA